jgi:hypothetical protein
MKWEPPPGEFADLICSWAIQTKMKNPDLPCDPYHLPDTATEDYNSDFNSPTKLVFGFAKKIIETFPDIKQTVITVHYPGTALPWHIDTEEYLEDHYKIHIPIETNTQSYFSFPTANTSSYISSTVTQSYMDCTIIMQPDFSLTTLSNLVGIIATSTPAGNQDKSLRMVINTGSNWTMNTRNPGDNNDWANPSASTFYINGVSGSTLTSGSAWYGFGGARTNTTSGAFSGSFPYYLGSGGYASDSRNFQGKIAVALLYNRALSAAEQAQNFNALRGRFGI